MARPSARTIAAIAAVPVAAALFWGVSTAIAASPGSAPAEPADGCFAAEPGGYTHPFGYPQPEPGDAAEEGVAAVIEIGQGSFTKYEIDAENGQLVADRFQSMPVAYPANYGSLPRTTAGDGDPLDVLVFTREPLVPGSVVQVRPIGTLRMVDGGEEDDKVIAVPTDDVDPTYADIADISDLPEIERERVESFFRVYKDLPDGRKEVELDGYANAEETRETVEAALTAYGESCG
ncbi:inorganic diphosphatase [Marinactinospora rubrisoli]|uniref:Inorganic pyrophosphatase n=1 Tax=Marinactinospora rubrisoli TaxID=2715399 RepID=A0ABW2KJL9_9ACTN